MRPLRGRSRSGQAPGPPPAVEPVGAVSHLLEPVQNGAANAHLVRDHPAAPAPGLRSAHAREAAPVDGAPAGGGAHPEPFQLLQEPPEERGRGLLPRPDLYLRDEGPFPDRDRGCVRAVARGVHRHHGIGLGRPPLERPVREVRRRALQPRRPEQPLLGVVRELALDPRPVDPGPGASSRAIRSANAGDGRPGSPSGPPGGLDAPRRRCGAPSTRCRTARRRRTGPPGPGGPTASTRSSGPVAHARSPSHANGSTPCASVSTAMKRGAWNPVSPAPPWT